ncbi:MAG: PAS domain-containing protein [Bacteroidales bacterium]|nr:PAS domain-containing protein [Bacteroidales bacterium]
MILRFDKEYNIVYANLCTERIYEIPRSFLIIKNIRDLDQPAEQSLFWVRNLERVFNLGISITEKLTINKNSRKFYYDVKFVPEKSETGNVMNVFATARDITELINKEKALYDSQWHLKQAQRIAKTGSWEWNLKYNKITLSDELHQILGYEPLENPPSIEVLRKYIHEDFVAFMENFKPIHRLLSIILKLK